MAEGNRVGRRMHDRAVGRGWRPVAHGLCRRHLQHAVGVEALAGEDRPADYVSAFGDDPFSRDQIAFFASHGIGTASSPTIPGARPGLYAITLSGAERSFTYWRSDAAARRLADDPAALAKSLENRALVYFSGITLAILAEPARSDAACRLAETRGGRRADRLRSELPAAAVAGCRDCPRGDRRSARRRRHRAADLPGRADAVRRRRSRRRRPADRGARRRRGRRQERRSSRRWSGAMAPARPCPPSTSPRPSTRPAPAIPSTAPISRHGLPASPPSRGRAQRRIAVAAAVVQVRGALAPFDGAAGCVSPPA